MLKNTIQRTCGSKLLWPRNSLFVVLLLALALGACTGMPPQNSTTALKTANRIVADPTLARPDGYPPGASYWALYAW